jgi:DNA-binding transcriptional ArsR family regulator
VPADKPAASHDVERQGRAAGFNQSFGQCWLTRRWGAVEDISARLLDRLLEKALEHMEVEERLAFVEKLFGEMPPAAQQEFLLKVARPLLGAGTDPGQLGMVLVAECDRPVRVQVVRPGPEGFGPWQACCQAMVDLVEAPDGDSGETAPIARVFNSLADETRLRIVKLLSKGELTVDELVEQLGLAQSTTSHHLRVLKEVNLIKGERRGRSIYYSLVHSLETAPEVDPGAGGPNSQVAKVEERP